MTMLRFTKFVNKVLDHTKKRTVRKKRKCNCGASIRVYGSAVGERLPKYKRDKCICQIKKGDMLQVYALINVGEAPVTDVQKLVLADFTDEDAQKDGFESCFDFEEGLQELHGDELYSEEFRIIDFDPQWKKQQIRRIQPVGIIKHGMWVSKIESQTVCAAELDNYNIRSDSIKDINCPACTTRIMEFLHKKGMKW